MKDKDVLMKKFIMLLLVVGACGRSLADEDSKYAAFETDLLGLSSKSDTGVVALVSREEAVMFHHALGKANLELQVPMQTSNVFEIGSITKIFTAVAIMRLVDEKLISLADPITKYLENVVSDHGIVTIEHLLAHTSGLQDPINTPVYMNTRLQESVTLKELVDMFGTGYWQHKPGDQVYYSNVGYSMLAAIIEDVTGLTYQQYMSKAFFEPLKMTSTAQASEAIRVGKVTGYTYSSNTPIQHGLLNLNWAFAAGDMLSTTTDLKMWMRALMQGRLLSEKSTQKLLTPIVLNDGRVTNGSFTFSLSDIADKQTVRISGSTMGYSSHMIYQPENELLVIVLQNSDGINGGGWRDPSIIAGKLLATALNLPLPNYQFVPVSNAKVSLLSGEYMLPSGSVRRLTFKQKQPYYQRDKGTKFKVVSMENDCFYFEDNLSYFCIRPSKDGGQQMNFFYFLQTLPEVANRF